MNVNEVLANRALQLLGRPLGDYDAVDPLDDLNHHQSTNDTCPTALRIAFAAALRQYVEYTESSSSTANWRSCSEGVINPAIPGERNAGKRLLEKIRHEHPRLPIIVVMIGI